MNAPLRPRSRAGSPRSSSTARRRRRSGRDDHRSGRPPRRRRFRSFATSPACAPDGNCRACMVEIKGERVLAPSCCRQPAEGMEVTSDSAARAAFAEDGRRDARLRHAREGLQAGLGARVLEERARDRQAALRAPRRSRSPTCRIRRWRSISTPASSARAACAPAARCRSTTSSAMRSAAPIRRSCSTSTTRWANRRAWPAANACRRVRPARWRRPTRRTSCRSTSACRSVCPYCGVGCQLTYHVKDNTIVRVEGRDGIANHERLCVKGRFGFDYVTHPQRLTKPLIRKPGVPKSADFTMDPADYASVFREATWEEALALAGGTLREIRDTHGTARAGRLRLGQGLERGGVPVPEARAHRLRLQQRRPLHAAVPRVERRGVARRHRLRRGVEPGDGRDAGRSRAADRRQPGRQSSGRGDVDQERGQERHAS